MRGRPAPSLDTARDPALLPAMTVLTALQRALLMAGQKTRRGDTGRDGNPEDDADRNKNERKVEQSASALQVQ